MLLLFFVLSLVTGEEMINIHYCMDAQNHKSKPGPEDQLHKQCTPWKSNSCCTNNVTTELHFNNLYGFTYDHCPQKMSDVCRRHFIQDFCFYECSPNVGPWIVKVNMKIRKERFFEVPLCAVDCDAWFKDCADDYTCTDNWTQNFVWKDGVNFCPVDSKCYTFTEVFGDAKTFCEKIWDHSWKYTPNEEPCMRLWFDGTKGNPNNQVAEWKVVSTGARLQFTHYLLVFCALYYLFTL